MASFEMRETELEHVAGEVASAVQDTEIWYPRGSAEYEQRVRLEVYRVLNRWLVGDARERVLDRARRILKRRGDFQEGLSAMDTLKADMLEEIAV